MKLSEKVAYLKGLEEGLNLDTGKAETKLIKGIIEAFDEIVDAIDTNTSDILEMTERVDEIDMDLGDLEAILFEGFEVEELTEEDLDELGEAIEDDLDETFSVVYTTDEEPEEEAVEEVEEEVEEEVVEEAPIEEEEVVVEEEEELDDEAIFAAAEEVVAAAEAEEASVFEEAAPVAAAAAASTVAWPEEEPEEVVEEVAEEAPVEEVIEREAEPEEATYEVECPTCGKVMYVDDTVLAQGGIVCPSCGEKLEFEVEYED